MIKAIPVAVVLLFLSFFNLAHAQNVNVDVNVTVNGIPQNNFNNPWQPGLPNTNLIPVVLDFDPRFVYDSRRMNTSLGFSGLVFNRLNILGFNTSLEVYRIRGIYAQIKTWGQAEISVCNRSGCVREIVFTPVNFDNFNVWTTVPLFVADSNSWMLFPLEISAFGVFRLNSITVVLEEIATIQPRGNGNIVANPGFQGEIIAGVPTGPGGPGVPIPIPTPMPHPIPHPVPVPPPPPHGGNIIINNIVTSGNSPDGLIYRNY